MGVSYFGKSLIPSPFLSIQKEYSTTDDGQIIGSLFVITLKGTLVAYKGSPASDGSLWDQSGYPPDEELSEDEHLPALLRKQEAIRQLFATEGQSFEVQGYDGSPPVKCNPRVKRISFNDGTWFNVCSYEIILEADLIYINGVAEGEDSGDITDYKVSRASQEWNIEPADDKGLTYRLTHNVSAQGKRFYNEAGSLTKPAWKNAEDYVLNKIGLGLDQTHMTASGVLGLSGYNAYNYTRTRNANELGGSFAVSETWLCFNANGQPPAVEDYSVNIQIHENGLVSVAVEGTVQGLEARNNTTYEVQSTRWENAESKYTDHIRNSLFDRARTISGHSLNAIPLQAQEGANPLAGTITFNYQYDSRASGVIPNAISEIVSVTNSHPSDVFAAIPVLGRALGPVLQDIGTKTVRKRTVQVEAVMPAASQTVTAVAPNTDALVATLAPAGSQVFVDQNEENFVYQTGRYSRTTSYTWEA